MTNALLGAAWEEAVKEAPERKWYRLLLAFGVLGSLPCRIVESPKKAIENAPTHLVFFSPVTGGEDLRIGALWPHKNEESGAEYLMGELDLAVLGILELKGGAKVDLRLVDGRLQMRLSAVKERASEKSPTHQLWRTKQRGKARTEQPSKQTDLPLEGPEEGDVAAA